MKTQKTKKRLKLSNNQEVQARKMNGLKRRIVGSTSL